MIGYVLDALRVVVLEPQAAEGVDADVRAVLDPDAVALDVDAAELDVIASTTRPLSREIGSGMLLRHIVTVLLSVSDGDLAKAGRRRDSITTDLILRAEDNRSLGHAASADGRQVISSLEWTVDYAETDPQGGGDTLAAFAILTFTIDADLDG